MSYRRNQLGDLPQDRVESNSEIVGVSGPVVRARKRTKSREINAKKAEFINRHAMTNRSYTVSNLSRRILPANPKRYYLIIVNGGNETIYVSFTSSANIRDSIPIVAGGNYEPWKVPYSEIHIRTDVGLDSVAVVGEGFVEEY